MDKRWIYLTNHMVVEEDKHENCFKNNNSINHSRSNNIIPRPEKHDDEIKNENKSSKPQGSQYCMGIMFP